MRAFSLFVDGFQPFGAGAATVDEVLHVALAVAVGAGEAGESVAVDAVECAGGVRVALLRGRSRGLGLPAVRRVGQAHGRLLPEGWAVAWGRPRVTRRGGW